MVTMELDRDSGLQVAASTPMDELQYSRLIFALGYDAVHSLRQSRALIVGCKGLGAEIAKNLLLSGIAGIGLVDEEVVCMADLGCNFCLHESDVGRNRAVSVANSLRELNPSADVDVITEPSIEASLSDYNIVAATSGTLPDLIRLSWLCRKVNIPFIASQTHGVFSFVFADLGDTYVFKDEPKEQSSLLLVANITQDNPATVTIVEEQRLGLDDGDEVTFSGIKGMEELNQGGSYKVTITGTHTFSIPLDTCAFGRYLSGGHVEKVLPSKRIHFAPLESSLPHPTFSAMDNPELSKQPHFHVALQAIDEYVRLSKRDGLDFSGHWLVEADIEKIVARGKDIWQCSGFLKSKGCGSDVVVCPQQGEKLSTLEIDPAIKGGASQNLNQALGVSGGSIEQVSILADESRVNKFGSFDEQLLRILVQTLDVELCPLVAITGGFAAQEVIKVLGKVFMPLHQWIYLDAVDCLPPEPQSGIEKNPLQSRYDRQISLFGKEFQHKLGSLEWLVVGAGGIGCEVLKNLVLMGVGCNSSGSISIADMDRISKPNYSDQLLYHIDDLGKQKASTAGRALRKINPQAQVHTFQEKFDVETENIFDSAFFQSVSGVFSAVDTASARLYIDMRCVTFRRPLIDGGKHGMKGSVQVFIPFQSEMYASTRDPPEFKESPICTLRNFPYSTEHTLRWAVDTFESLFKQRPLDVNAYLSNRDFQDSVKKANPSARLPILETLCDALSRHKPLSFAACIHWARLQFEDLFSNSIKQLSFNFPKDMTTTAGAPFWSGTKRAPVPITFNVMEPLHYNFIVAAANLQATVYGLKGCQDRVLFLDVLRNVNVPAFQPKEGIKIATSDGDLRSGGQQKSFLSSEDNDAVERCDVLMQELPTPASLAGYRLTPIEFEKDDEQNFHVEFVSAAANLRAQNYGIPTSDLLQARLVGGRAIPSVVTATSVIGGMMCLELYKLVLQKPLECFKHSYVNLAVPFIATAEPIRAIVNRVERNDHPPLLWTLWDKFEMSCVGMSLETFLREFKQQYGLEITMLSYGKSLLYAEFVPRKKLQERMPLTLLDLITTIAKVTIPATENRVVFSVSCSDASDNDVDVPDVLVAVR
ncbi:hypothetical protein GOP47_0017984 [Adiantum capillus-veneris]|uniref:Ubiquitin-activating enzyme E1 C-terminal domain-containing protein n=1 Tax=Adiantum capillus-veneris TaxID=13818 RepID=A0A9D4UHL8_ADICA|nr:hypothetical protein GOP47_0017984 [Adiantum capillus-veneris]